jgi:hypothetical protein
MATAIRPDQGKAQRGGPGRTPGTALALLALVAGGLALLALLYYRLSWTVPATSDGAAIALQAQDMLHGNWLLHGWNIGDVSFYTTELPEYAIVEAVRGLGPSAIHTAAAVTYALLVLLAGLLARGRARGREGLSRGLLAAGIMLAPQLGYGAFVLLLSPDHTGTQVPLLLGWLLLDLAPRRWWVPVLLGALLACVQFADRVALLTAIVPLMVVGCVYAVRAAARARPGPRGGRLRACWFELSLAAAAVMSVLVSFVAARLLTAAGGFTAHPLPFVLAPLRLLWVHTRLTGEGILELYGANFVGVHGWVATLFAVAHLAGLALAGTGFAIALSRFVRLRPDADLVDGVLAVAIACNLISYILSIEPGTTLDTGYDAREIAAVLPLGAVLAGRVLGPKLARLLEPTARSGKSGLSLALGGSLGAVGLCYVAALLYGTAQPAVPPENAVLASWLTQHHLSYGLAGLPSNIATVDSGGRVRLAVTGVSGGRVRALLYQSQASAYDPRLHDANFLVTGTPATGPGIGPTHIPGGVVMRTFGPPARVYHFHGYTVMVWDVNLLTRLR